MNNIVNLSLSEYKQLVNGAKAYYQTGARAALAAAIENELVGAAAGVPACEANQRNYFYRQLTTAAAIANAGAVILAANGRNWSTAELFEAAKAAANNNQ